MDNTTLLQWLSDSALFAVSFGIIIKLLWNNQAALGKLNDRLFDMLSQFAPRKETEERIINLESRVNNNTNRISIIEEWKKNIGD